MANLRTTAQQVLEEARDGIAWIALYKEGRGWRAACFWPDIDRDGKFTFDLDDDTQELKAILTTDPEAIFVNGYYSNLGPIEGMTRESLSSALRWQYEEHFNQLADTVAETPSGASPGGVLSRPDDGRTERETMAILNEKVDYLLAVKSKYTYRIYPNRNDEMSVEVQLSDDFKRITLENFALATMTKDDFNRASLQYINHLLLALRKHITKSGSHYADLPVY